MGSGDYAVGPVAFLAVFFLVPFLLLLAISFTKAFPLSWSPSLESYALVASKSIYLSFLGNTLLFGAVVTLLCAVLGYPVAFFLVKVAKRSYGLLLLATVSPLLVGVVVRAVGWTIMLGVEGVLNRSLIGIGLISQPLQMLYTPAAAVLGMVHVLMCHGLTSVMG